MWFGVLPVVMCVGTLALMLANYTTIFDVLGAPFMPLLEFLQVPEAQEVSKTMIVGFTDMFTPSVIAAEGIADPMSRFIVATVSVTQLIYLSEAGRPYLGLQHPCQCRRALHPVPGTHDHQLDHHLPRRLHLSVLEESPISFIKGASP